MTTYMIWSNEHRAWWRPARRGYTTVTLSAGRYSAEEADEILREANFNPAAPPNEVKCLAPAAETIVDEMREAVTGMIRMMDHPKLIEALQQLQGANRTLGIEG